MTKRALILALALPLLPGAIITVQGGEQVALKAAIYPPEGWMRSGWGQLVLEARNPNGNPAVLEKVVCAWLSEDGSVLKEWTQELAAGIAPGDRHTEKLATWFDPQAIDKGPDGGGRLQGTLYYREEGTRREIPFILAVPEAMLPEKLRTAEGRNLGLSLMESRFGLVDNMEAIVESMDEMYDAMHALTGRKPYGGAKIDFRESPRHMAWAYAGNPTVLNTAYVQDALKGYAAGEICFGWVHEMGHDFDDGIGKWYIPSGPWAEWQANFKLSYAWEQRALPDSAFKVRLWTRSDRSARQPLVEGRRFNDEYFIPFGSDYLDAPEREWTSLRSDEIHSFHTQLVRLHGWDLFKQWYRAYPALEARGCRPPSSPEEKILLECALLSEIGGTDLLPVFQQWRLPVSAEGMERIREKYPVAAVAAERDGDQSPDAPRRPR